MSPNSTKPSHPDLHYFVPTLHFKNCEKVKIYVNTIINAPSNPPSENASTKKRDHDISKSSPGDKKLNICFIDPREGGSATIYCGSEEGSDCDSLPMIYVEIQKLSSQGTSEINPKTYVITAHQNNGSGNEIMADVSQAERRAIDHIIGADNVILNSTGGEINVGPGAKGTNSGPGSASIRIPDNK